MNECGKQGKMLFRKLIVDDQEKSVTGLSRTPCVNKHDSSYVHAIIKTEDIDESMEHLPALVTTHF